MYTHAYEFGDKCFLQFLASEACSRTECETHPLNIRLSGELQEPTYFLSALGSKVYTTTPDFRIVLGI